MNTRSHGADQRTDNHRCDNTWRRSRQPLHVHPPRFVTMTDRDKQYVHDALVALLIDHLRDTEHPRSAAGMNARRRP
jgi:hypothetical protein